MRRKKLRHITKFGDLMVNLAFTIAGGIKPDRRDSGGDNPGKKRDF
jgi:hypothetical protein